MEVIGADGVHSEPSIALKVAGIKLTRADSGEGRTRGHIISSSLGWSPSRRADIRAPPAAERGRSE